MARVQLNEETAFPDDGAERCAKSPRGRSDRRGRTARNFFGGGEYYDGYVDATYGVLWALLKPDCPSSFTWELLRALRDGQHAVEQHLDSGAADKGGARLNYQVFGSRIPGVFSRGGDLALFRNLIAAGDRDALFEYARAGIDVVYTNAVNYHRPITTISLIQGEALGGGFEAALAANVVVAERGCRMGMPEIMFNLFPGMGACQLLQRRVSSHQAERLIAGGRLYTAEQLHELGVVDIVAEPGMGEEAVRGYIKSTYRQRAGRHALRRAMRDTGALDYDGLLRVAEIWVETALQLRPGDLEVIDYLIRAQRDRGGDSAAGTGGPVFEGCASPS